MNIRPTVRLLVIDEQQRLLLFKYEDAAETSLRLVIDPQQPDLRAYWVTPGGGVEPGETFEQAALRELWEETGLRLDGLGPRVWYRQRALQFSEALVQFQEHYYLAPVQTSRVELSNLTEQERQVYRGHRWWTLAEMERTAEVLMPPGLPRLLHPLLAGQFPPEPVILVE